MIEPSATLIGHAKTFKTLKRKSRQNKNFQEKDFVSISSKKFAKLDFSNIILKE